MILGPEILLPLENTPVSFIDTSVPQETKVPLYQPKRGRVKGKKGFFPCEFPVRSCPLKRGKDGVAFLYSLGTWSHTDYELQVHHSWWGHQPKWNKFVLLCFHHSNDHKLCFNKNWDFGPSALKMKSDLLTHSWFLLKSVLMSWGNLWCKGRNFWCSCDIKSQRTWLTFNRYSNMACLNLLGTSNIHFKR